jgi:predicted RNA-binding Zn-ribbon protein involved in translation (DUF1610 family)
MAERIKLPQVTGFRVTGFEPIYSAEIDLDMEDGPYVILGGNGLGKTTMMQAVVYALAGGLDDKTEEIKSLRWSNSYFRGRLNSTQIASAQVEVDFKLGNRSISVRRGFKGSNAIAVKEGRSGWIETDAPEKFAEILREHGGYLDASDFAFVVHRLLYLPESRRLIAWDTDAQIRLLMLLNQDIAIERDFREQRAQLKLLDSKKRHFRVALNNASEELARLLEYEHGPKEEEEEEKEAVAEIVEEDGEKQLPALVAELHEVGQKRAEAERRSRGAATDLSRVSGQIDLLRQKIEAAEAGLVANFLAETEREQNLALAKLVENAICPACGQRHIGLADLARKHVRDHKCILCGSDESQMTNPDLTKFQDELEQLLRQQQAFEDVVRLARAESENLHNQELDLQSEVNEVRYKRPVVAMLERNLPQMTTDNLKKLKKQLEDDEADAAAQIETIRTKLTEEYDDFRRKMNVRMENLRASYANYATAFLGLPCELDEVGQDGLLDLKLFVPRFDETVRPQADSCSEAQRFFLDIAFRMALIDAASGKRGTATFFCETPETALDMSYVRNVVSMFSSFAEKQHNILLTANVQTAGIAEKLLERIPMKERPRRIVNLLDYGRLSSVQKAAIDEFKEILKRMLTAPMVKG